MQRAFRTRDSSSDGLPRRLGHFSRKALRVAVGTAIVLLLVVLGWLCARRPSIAALSPQGGVIVIAESPSVYQDLLCFFGFMSPSSAPIELCIVEYPTGAAIHRVRFQPWDVWEEWYESVIIAWHPDGKRFLCVYEMQGGLGPPFRFEGFEILHDPFSVAGADWTEQWAEEAVTRQFGGDSRRRRRKGERVLEELHIQSKEMHEIQGSVLRSLE